MLLLSGHKVLLAVTGLVSLMCSLWVQIEIEVLVALIQNKQKLMLRIYFKNIIQVYVPKKNITVTAKRMEITDALYFLLSSWSLSATSCLSSTVALKFDLRGSHCSSCQNWCGFIYGLQLAETDRVMVALKHYF